MSWEHKTAPTIIMSTEVSRNAFSDLQRHQRRGVHAQLPMTPRESPRTVASVRVKEGAAEFDVIRDRQQVIAGDRVNTNPARCHPDREAVSPTRQCLQCVVKWYSDRRKRG